jgi:hypothetical protein
MKLMLGQLSEDWEKRWGHPIVLVETFIDPRFYQGTAYKVSGWSHLGRTAGWKRQADDFYEKNDAPKQIWVRELVKKACVKLRAPELAPAWAKVEASVPPRCTAKAEQIRSLMEAVRAELTAAPRPGLSHRRVALSDGHTRRSGRSAAEDAADYADTRARPNCARALPQRAEQWRHSLSQEDHLAALA